MSEQGESHSRLTHPMRIYYYYTMPWCENLLGQVGKYYRYTTPRTPRKNIISINFFHAHHVGAPRIGSYRTCSGFPFFQIKLLKNMEEPFRFWHIANKFATARISCRGAENRTRTSCSQSKYTTTILRPGGNYSLQGFNLTKYSPLDNFII